MIEIKTKALKQILDQEVESTLALIKANARTYGEAMRIIADLDWSKETSDIKRLIIKNVDKALQQEMNLLEIKKPSGNLA